MGYSDGKGPAEHNSRGRDVPQQRGRLCFHTGMMALLEVVLPGSPTHLPCLPRDGHARVEDGCWGDSPGGACFNF